MTGLVESFGYKLKSEYTHSRHKIYLECPNGHTTPFYVFEFKKGKRCSICKNHEKRQEKIKEMESLIPYGYSLKEFINNGEVYLFCDQGHVWKTCKGTLKNKHRCSKCVGNMKFDYEEVKQYVENNGYKLISSTYKNANTKLDMICPNNHEYSSTFHSFNSGYRCQKCYLQNNVGTNASNWRGGTTYIYQYLRGYLTEWKKKVMHQCGYKCVITGSKDFEIHHLYSFNKIVKEVIQEVSFDVGLKSKNLTDSQLRELAETFDRIHKKYEKGVCLRKDIHALFHDKFGFDNTPEQFEMFKTDLLYSKEVI